VKKSPYTDARTTNPAGTGFNVLTSYGGMIQEQQMLASWEGPIVELAIVMSH